MENMSSGYKDKDNEMCVCIVRVEMYKKMIPVKVVKNKSWRFDLIVMLIYKSMEGNEFHNWTILLK